MPEKKKRIKEVVSLAKSVFEGPLEEIVNNVQSLIQKYNKDATVEFILDEDYWGDSISYIDINMTVYREETDEELKVRLEKEKKKKINAKLAKEKREAKAKLKAEKEEKQMRELFEALKKKYEPT